jgi:hypothetical protein
MRLQSRILRFDVILSRAKDLTIGRESARPAVAPYNPMRWLVDLPKIFFDAYTGIEN